MKESLGAKLRRAADRVRGMFRPSGVILLYHRVSAPVSDPYNLCVSPKHFEKHLQVIRKVGYPVPLSVVANGLREGQLSNGSVCLTFDDGYQDNLYTAKPLLEKYDIPATVFMTTGRLGRDREFWWDELERIFLQPGHLPARLQLGENGSSLDRDLGTSVAYTSEDLYRDRAWALFEADDFPTPRHSVFKELYTLMQPMHTAERTQMLDRLLHWADRTSFVRPAHRALEPEEVVTLAEDGLIEVGGHTVNHPALPSHPVWAQRDEIRGCKKTLEQWLGHEVQSFAYPYGLYSEVSVAQVREAGFGHACSCSYRSVRPGSDPFLLPRIEVVDWDGETFEKHLRWHLGQ